MYRVGVMHSESVRPQARFNRTAPMEERGTVIFKSGQTTRQCFYFPKLLNYHCFYRYRDKDCLKDLRICF